MPSMKLQSIITSDICMCRKLSTTLSTTTRGTNKVYYINLKGSAWNESPCLHSNTLWAWFCICVYTEYSCNARSCLCLFACICAGAAAPKSQHSKKKKFNTFFLVKFFVALATLHLFVTKNNNKSCCYCSPFIVEVCCRIFLAIFN